MRLRNLIVACPGLPSLTYFWKLKRLQPLWFDEVAETHHPQKEVIVPSWVEEPGKLRASRTNARAWVGNHPQEIPALRSQVLDVTGDHVGDLVLEYQAKATLDLAAVENEPIAFRYESASGTGGVIR